MDKCEAAGCVDPGTELVRHTTYEGDAYEESRVCRKHQVALVQRDVARFMLPLLKDYEILEAVSAPVKGVLEHEASSLDAFRRLTTEEVDTYLPVADRHLAGWQRIAEIVAELPDPQMKALAAQADERLAKGEAWVGLFSKMRWARDDSSD